MNSTKINKIISYIAICFSVALFSLNGTTVFKLIYSLLGIGGDRRLLSVSTFLIFDIFLILFFCKFITEQKDRKSQIIILVFLISMFIIPDMILDTKVKIIQFIIIKIPFVILGMILALSDDFRKDYFKYNDKLAPFIALFAVSFIILLLTVNDPNGEIFKLSNGSLKIKDFTYGNVAFVFLPFFELTFTSLASGKYKGKKEIVMILYILLLIYTICCTGLRNAILSIIIIMFLSVLFVVFGFFQKCSVKRVALILAVLVLTVVVINNTERLVPSTSRLQTIENEGVTYDLKSKKIEDEPIDGEISKELLENKFNDSSDLRVIDVKNRKITSIEKLYTNYIFSSNKPERIINEMLHDDVRNGTGKYIIVSDINKKFASKYTVHRSRNYLWRAAINEWEKSKLIGNGIKHFQKKYYGTMPHNVLLELLSDYGIVGTILFFLLCLYLFVKSITYIKSGDIEQKKLLIIAISAIPQFLLYTSLYDNEQLIFIITFLMFCTYLSIKNKRKELEIERQLIKSNQ